MKLVLIVAIAVVIGIVLLLPLSTAFAETQDELNNEEYCKTLEPFDYNVGMQVTTI